MHRYRAEMWHKDSADTDRNVFTSNPERSDHVKYVLMLALVSLLSLAGCGNVPQAVVKPSQQTVQFPTAMDIQHVYVMSGLAALTYSPKNQSETVAQIEKWLATAKPVSVQLPPPPNPPIGIDANTNPAVLELQLSSIKQISISPTFYMAGHSQDLSKVYHFVDGVISYQVGNETVYFKDPNLYIWLKNNQWQKQFNAKLPQWSMVILLSEKLIHCGLNGYTSRTAENVRRYGAEEFNATYLL